MRPRHPWGGFVLLPTLVVGTACTGESDQPSGAAAPLVEISAAMPSVRQVELPALDANTVRGPGGRVAVGPDGKIAYLPVEAPDHDFVLQIVDSTGAQVGLIGRRGKGPGELTSPMFFEFESDSSLVVWDMSTGRVTAFAMDGRVLAAMHPGELQSPQALVGDSLDYRDVRQPEAPMLRRSIRGGSSRRIGGTGAAFDSLFPIRDIGGVVTRGFLSYASGTARMAFGQGHRYQILLYDATGRYLGTAGRSLPLQYPTAERIAQESLSLLQQPSVSPARRGAMIRAARERPITFFREIRFDDSGRLWVFRTDRGGAVADIYADTVLVGSIPLDCPGFEGSGVGLGFGWLVLSCRNLDPDAPSDGIFRLFRIEG